MPWREVSFVEWAISAAFVVVGALVHTANQWRQRKEQGTHLDWISRLILFITALFSGALGGFAVHAFTGDTNFSIPAAALCAFLGIEGLELVSKILLGFLQRRFK